MSGCGTNLLFGQKVKVYKDYKHNQPEYEGIVLMAIKDKLIIKKDKGHLATTYPNNCQILGE